jgi:hypothetical protein
MYRKVLATGRSTLEGCLPRSANIAFSIASGVACEQL